MPELRLGRDEIRALADEVLGRGGSFRFQAHGRSMQPFIHDGDILTIEPPGPGALQVGDVALYVGCGERITAHRVVGVDARNGETVLLMRGDAQPGPAERVRPEQVLGRCVSLQRADRTLDLDHPARRRATLLWRRSYPLGPALLGLPVAAAQGALWLLRRLQALKPYRALARAWFGKRAGYRVATVHDASALAGLYAYEQFPGLGDPVTAMAGQLAGLGERSCTLVATVGERIVGAAGLHPFPAAPEDYREAWLSGIRVQTRYRGAGIGEGLVRAALDRASAEGVSQVVLLVFEDNRAAVRLYEKLGFRPASIPTLDEPLAAEVRAGHKRRVILARPLP